MKNQTTQLIRLQKIIAQGYDLSRRAAEKAILSGRVTVNGKTVSILGTKVNPKTDIVCVDGKTVELPKQYYYLAYYKPCGQLVTKHDPYGRETIWTMLPRWKPILNSAGRLDLNSEGLLILTNDGSLINALTHPRHAIRKVYEVRIKGVPNESKIKRLQNGIKLAEGLTKPAKVKVIDKQKNSTVLEIIIEEGKKRQIRRMCQAIGHSVIALKRIAVGNITLGNMSPGQSRQLTNKEIEGLMKLTI